MRRYEHTSFENSVEFNVDEHRKADVMAVGDCCFNHIIGLPQKDGLDKPLYHYEQIIFDFLVPQTSNKQL